MTTYTCDLIRKTIVTSDNITGTMTYKTGRTVKSLPVQITQVYEIPVNSILDLRLYPHPEGCGCGFWISDKKLYVLSYRIIR